MTEIIKGAERAVVDTESTTGPDLAGGQLNRLLHGEASLERASQALVVIDRQGAPDWEPFSGADYYQPGAPVDARTVEAVTQLLERIEDMAQRLAAQPAAAPQTVTLTASAPLDFGGRYPSPAEAAGIVPMAPLRAAVHVRHWGKALALSSAGIAVAGAASGVVVGTAVGPVGMVVGGIVGAVAGTARALREQDQENGS